MAQTENSSAMPQSVVDTVFDDFTSHLEQGGLVDSVVITRLRDALRKKQYSVEKLRTALFAEDNL
jgi:hypothetical protein